MIPKIRVIGYLNDLWRYQMNDSTWTWISGNNTVNQPSVYGEKGISNANNHPGARAGAIGWYDSLRKVFWLFGGDTGSGLFVQPLYKIFAHNSHFIT